MSNIPSRFYGQNKPISPPGRNQSPRNFPTALNFANAPNKESLGKGPREDSLSIAGKRPFSLTTSNAENLDPSKVHQLAGRTSTTPLPSTNKPMKMSTKDIETQSLSEENFSDSAVRSTYSSSLGFGMKSSSSSLTETETHRLPSSSSTPTPFPPLGLNRTNNRVATASPFAAFPASTASSTSTASAWAPTSTSALPVTAPLPVAGVTNMQASQLPRSKAVATTTVIEDHVHQRQQQQRDQQHDVHQQEEDVEEEEQSHPQNNSNHVPLAIALQTNIASITSLPLAYRLLFPSHLEEVFGLFNQRMTAVLETSFQSMAAGIERIHEKHTATFPAFLDKVQQEIDDLEARQEEAYRTIEQLKCQVEAVMNHAALGGVYEKDDEGSGVEHREVVGNGRAASRGESSLEQQGDDDLLSDAEGDLAGMEETAVVHQQAASKA